METLGEYTVQARLTSGPDAELILGRSADDSQLIIKRLPIAYRFDKQRRQTFTYEANLASKLSHPGFRNLIALSEIDGELVQIYDWAGGQSIASLLTTCRRHYKRIPIAIGFVLLRQIVAALDELHNRVAEDDSLPSDLHVALRPDALNLCDDGQCQILQFSLIPPPSITRSIIYSGEQSYAMYAAPEQCVAGPIPDFRADFFTLGMLGFELLTSKSLFCLESGEMKMSLVNRRKIRCLHPLLSDVDPDLEKYDDAVIGLLQPLPELRTGQLDTFRSSITDAIAHGDVMAGTSDVCAFITEMQNLERAETLRESVSDSSSKPSMMSTIAQYNAS